MTVAVRISTGYLDENPPPFEIYSEGNRILSVHGLWAVTTYGIEALPTLPRYPIAYADLLGNDWLGHIAAKGDVDMPGFVAAFRVALRHVLRRKPQPDFGEWLCAQTDRSDTIGELADRVAMRRDFRPSAAYLERIGASHLVSALDEARDEWRAMRKRGARGASL